MCVPEMESPSGQPDLGPCDLLLRWLLSPSSLSSSDFPHTPLLVFLMDADHGGQPRSADQAAPELLQILKNNYILSLSILLPDRYTALFLVLPNLLLPDQTSLFLLGNEILKTINSRLRLNNQIPYQDL